MHRLVADTVAVDTIRPAVQHAVLCNTLCCAACCAVKYTALCNMLCCAVQTIRPVQHAVQDVVLCTMLCFAIAGQYSPVPLVPELSTAWLQKHSLVDSINAVLCNWGGPRAGKLPLHFILLRSPSLRTYSDWLNVLMLEEYLHETSVRMKPGAMLNVVIDCLGVTQS